MNCVAELRGRTYVVEDHDLVRSVLTSWFSSRGHRVEPCDPSDLQALDSSGRHDLIVLDLCLGDRDGIDVLQHLADRRFGGAVILISAFPDSVIETARDIGTDFGLHVVGTLRKPVAFDRLDELLDLVGHRGRAVRRSPARTPSLGEALAAGRIAFHAQPILDARSREVRSVEMLARLLSADGAPVSVGDVLAEASSAELHELARLALAGAEEFGRRLTHRGLDPLPVSINVPSSFIHRRNFAPIVDRFERFRFPITFEVSELDPFEDMREARRTTASAVLRGLRFSLDDFGMSNSNIDRLMRIPFDELKLDRSFVTGCADDSFRETVCRCAVQLAHGRGAIVVAEGVETSIDFAHVRFLGVDRVQGYLFSRPLPPDVLVDWIAGHRPDDFCGGTDHTDTDMVKECMA